MKCPGCGRGVDSGAVSIAIERGVGLRCKDCETTISYKIIVDAVSKTMARKCHPSTSAEAAVYFAPKRRGSQLRALGFVSNNPGKTANELALIAEDRDSRKIGRRLPELEKEGLVTRGGPRECQVTGRNATIWFTVGSQNQK